MEKEIEKFNRSISYLDHVLPNISKNKENKGLTEFGLMLFIDRTYCGLRSAQLILNQFHKDYDHGLGLIFRGIISDFFLVVNLVNYAPKSDEVNSTLLSYFKDAENMMIKIGDMEATGMYPAEVISKIRENLEEKSSRRGVIRTSVLSGIKPSISTTDIFKKLKTNSTLDEQIRKTILHAYDLWKFYSQYEHFGLSSYELTRNPFGEDFNNRIVSILKLSFFIFTICLKNLNREVEEQKLANFLFDEICN